MGRAAITLPATRATLVAYYGDKSAELSDYFSRLQGLVASKIEGFEPYALSQVHATLVGLEGYVARHSFIVNANFLEARGQVRIVRAARLLDTLRASLRQPLMIRLGGFTEAAAYPFTSRQQHPYVRSFSLQDRRVVAMGWPRANHTFPRTLARLRRELEPAGVLHKYHRAPAAGPAAGDDNDLYFVLGQLTAARELALQPLLTEGRRFMAEHPLDIVLGSEDLRLVTYSDPSLRRASSRAYRLEELDPRTLERIISSAR